MTDSFKEKIVDAGGVHLLVAVLQRGREGQKVDAIAILRNLALASTPVKSEITSRGGIEALVELLRTGSNSLRVQAAAALWSLVFDPTSRDAIVNAGGIEALLDRVRVGANDQANYALRTLREIVVANHNHEKFRRLGGCGVLIHRAFAGTDLHMELVWEILLLLVVDAQEETLDRIVNVELIRLLIKASREDTNKRREHATKLLSQLVVHSRKAKEQFLREDGVATFRALLIEGTDEEKVLVHDVLHQLTQSDECIVVTNGGGISRCCGGSVEPSKRDIQPLVTYAVDVTTVMKQLRDCDEEMTTVATSTLVGFVREHPAITITIVQQRGIPDLIGLVEKETNAQKINAVRVLGSIADIPTLRTTIIAAGGLYSLAQCVRDKSGDKTVKSSKRLFAKAYRKAHHSSTEVLDNASTRRSALLTYSDSLQSEAMRTLTKLARADIAIKSLIAHSGFPRFVMIYLVKRTACEISSAKELIFELVNIESTACLVLSFLVTSLYEGSKVEQQDACHTLRCLLTEVGQSLSKLVVPAGAVRPLLTFLREGTEDMKTDALVVIREMVCMPRHCRTYLIEGGVIPAIVEILNNGLCELQTFAMSTLEQLVNSDVETQIIETGAIGPVVRLAREGPKGHQDAAASLLSNLARFPSTRAEILRLVVDATTRSRLSAGTSEQKASALQTLCELALENGFRSALGEFVPQAIDFVCMGNDIQKRWAVELVGRLAPGSPHNRALVVKAGGCGALVELMRIGSEDQKDMAVTSLESLTSWQELGAASACIKAGGLPLLREMAQHGTTNTQKEAAVGILDALSAIDVCRSSIVDAGGVRVLVILLCSGIDAVQLKSLRALRGLTCTESIRSVVGDVNVYEPVIRLLTDGGDDHKTNSARLLFNLAHDCPPNRLRIALAGGVAALVHLMQHGTEDQQEAAATALYASSPGNELVLVNAGCIQASVQLVRAGVTSQLRASAMQILYCFSKIKSYHPAITEIGGVHVLVGRLRSGSDVEKEWSLCVLSNLARNTGVRTAIGAAGANPPTINIVRVGSDSLKQYGVELLSKLTYECPSNRVLVIQAGGVPVLVGLVRSGTATQQQAALNALDNIIRGHEAELVKAGGIMPFVKIIRSGTDKHKVSALAVLLLNCRDR